MKNGQIYEQQGGCDRNQSFCIQFFCLLVVSLCDVILAYACYGHSASLSDVIYLL